ncbi:MAG: flavin reductase family protein [Gemmatimonadota bacterium]|nr:flavin reductase family protein [Gemmatimonadota bacterium]
MARWASTVTVVAVRDEEDGKVRATTATSFAPVSAEPPEVVVSLNPSAQALPFVEEGGEVGISLLSEDQGRWATVFADPVPVGPTPWREQGVPVIPDASAALECRVRAIHATEGGSRLVVVRVEEIELGPSDRPLLFWAREYRTLPDG